MIYSFISVIEILSLMHEDRTFLCMLILQPVDVHGHLSPSYSKRMKSCDENECGGHYIK